MARRMSIRVGGPGLLSTFRTIARATSPLMRSASIFARSSASGIRDGYFDQSYWEQEYPGILEDQRYKAGNAGQESILTNDWYNAANDYCLNDGQNFTKDEFLSYIENAIGSDKFNAVSIISEECAEELELAWDDSYGGDNQGPTLFKSNGSSGKYSADEAWAISVGL